MGIIRQTQSLKRILNEFEKEPKALSTVDLIERLRKDHNKTTIYRVLDRLEDDGVLHSFQGTDGVSSMPNAMAAQNHDIQIFILIFNVFLVEKWTA